MNEIQKCLSKTSLCCLVLLLLLVQLYDWTEHFNSLSIQSWGNGDVTTGATKTPIQRLLSSLTNQEFEECIETLEQVSGNDDKVGMDEFIVFLEMYSGRDLSVEDFQDLPTPFVLIFYTAACSFGDACDSEEEPTISLGNLEDAGAVGVMYMFCQSVKTVSAVQLSMNFQFQIRHVGDDETSIKQFLTGSEGSELIQALEDITEEVLMHQFGCGVDSRSRTLKNWRSAHYLAQYGEGRRTTAMVNAQKHRQSEAFDLQLDQFGFSEDVCDYTVSTLVQTIRPSGESTLNLIPQDIILLEAHIHCLRFWFQPAF
jgi:hypothetical protein